MIDHYVAHLLSLVNQTRRERFIHNQWWFVFLFFYLSIVCFRVMAKLEHIILPNNMLMKLVEFWVNFLNQPAEWIHISTCWPIWLNRHWNGVARNLFCLFFASSFSGHVLLLNFVFNEWTVPSFISRSMSVSRTALRALQDLITLGEKSEKFNRIFQGVSPWPIFRTNKHWSGNLRCSCLFLLLPTRRFESLHHENQVTFNAN